MTNKLTREEGEEFFRETNRKIYIEKRSIAELRDFFNTKLTNGGINYIKDERGDTILHSWIMDRERGEVVKLLLEYKPNLDIKDNKWGVTPFLLVSHMVNNTNNMQILLDYANKAGINIINQKSRDGSTALHNTTRRGDLPSVEILLNNKANIQAKDVFGNSPLHVVASAAPDVFNRDYIGVAKYLISKKALIDSTNINGKTSLHLAAENGWLPMMQLLLNNNASPDIVDIEGKTPLQVAIENGHLESVKLLYNTQAKNITDKSGKTLIHLAAVGGNIKVLQFLMSKLDSYKEVINAKDKNGRTSVHLAVTNGHIKMLEVFKSYGSDINIRDSEGNTALHLAAKQNTPDIVQELITLGANINVGTQIKDTALKILNNNLRIIKNRSTNKEIQRIFQENNLIARIIEIKDEMFHLHTVNQDGNYGKVERSGNRARSATLLFPEINIELYNTGLTKNTGLLYDADKATIRDYMMKDGGTSLHLQKRKNFYNIQSRNKSDFSIVKSKDIISKKGLYQEYTEDVSKLDKTQVRYNELITNLFPESMVGILINATSPRIKPLEAKAQALKDKYYISAKYGYDLPMVIIKDREVEVWNPELEEIKTLLNSTDKINPSKLGFVVGTDGDIITLNKYEVTFKEAQSFFEARTNKHISQPTIGYMAKLLEVVNVRLSDDALPPIDSLNNFIIHKEDIKNLITSIQSEKVISNKNYKKMSSEELEEMTQNVLATMQSKRPDKSTFPELQDYKSVKDILEKNQSEIIKGLENSRSILKIGKMNRFFKTISSNDYSIRNVRNKAAQPSNSLGL